MTPRLATSKTWTGLPQEFILQIQKAFADNFSEEAQEGEFIAEGRIYPQEILLRLGFLEKGRLRQINFEASVTYDSQKDKAIDSIYLGLDAAAHMMGEYFMRLDEGEPEGEEDQAEFPRQWQAFNFDQKEVFLQFSTVNSKLEQEADRLLGLTGEGMVRGEIPEPQTESGDENGETIH